MIFAGTAADDLCWNGCRQRFRCVVDCQIVAGLVNGEAALTNETYRPLLRRVAACLDKILQKGWRPPEDWSNTVAWRRRAWNKQADWVVNAAMDMQQDIGWTDTCPNPARDRSNVLVFSDGGLRRKTGLAAAGFAAYVHHEGSFRLITYRGVFLHEIQSSFQAELIGLDMATQYLSQHIV